MYVENLFGETFNEIKNLLFSRDVSKCITCEFIDHNYNYITICEKGCNLCTSCLKDFKYQFFIECISKDCNAKLLKNKLAEIKKAEKSAVKEEMKIDCGDEGKIEEIICEDKGPEILKIPKQEPKVFLILNLR
jgi:hypothetical protein